MCTPYNVIIICMGWVIEYQVKCVSDKDMDTKYRKLYYFRGELRRDMEIWWLRCLLFIWVFGQLLTGPMIKCPVIFLLRDTGNYSDNRTCLFDTAGNKVLKITEKAPTKTPPIPFPYDFCIDIPISHPI